MKKILYLPLFVALLLSCSDETLDGEISQQEESQGVRIHLALGEEAFSPVLPFFDSNPACQPWEKEINSLTVCVYNPGNGTFFKRVFTTGEIAARRFDFVFPDAKPGDECEFYAVANMEVPAMNREELLSMKDPAISDYNAKFYKVAFEACREEGFVMSGSTTQILSLKDGVTYVTLPLRRTVAKIAVQLQFSEEFMAKNPGLFLLGASVGIGPGSYSSWVFPHENTHLEWISSLWSMSMDKDGEKFQALFYAFEYDNDVVWGFKTLSFTVFGDYPDGNGQNIYYYKTYAVTIGGSEKEQGKIQRNTYYRIQVIISGFTGSEIETDISVAPWDGLYTENIIIDEDD